VSRAGGRASLFRADAWQRTEIRERFQPLAAPVMTWHQALKSALDPDLLLNPGRMYAEF
jgi:glycolate oxidase FAD binding subunit